MAAAMFMINIIKQEITFGEYKKMQNLSVTLNNVDTELQDNREKIKILTENNNALNIKVKSLVGIIAKAWRKSNPELAKNGNMRDHTDLLHLIILNNLENTNDELIRINIKQSDRLVQLHEFV